MPVIRGVEGAASYSITRAPQYHIYSGFLFGEAAVVLWQFLCYNVSNSPKEVL